ncbi:TIGR00730 family Rossman fold protein [Methylocystis echinoides]|uniref:LOG family protein n=1 Tax=Methylocystis echinoides TaxID=29468 RepID=UPI00343A167C
MQKIKNICVYCGSAQGDDLRYAAAAETFGRILAKAGVGLVFGGGSCGLMGITARAVLNAGGRVTGIIPDFLEERELAMQGMTDLIVVDHMHTRKRLMFEKSDAFVALPGGVGTLEELTEQLTWIQLGRHTKPLVIADIAGFWRPLLTLFAHMHNSGFIREGYEVRYLVAERVEDILPMIQTTARRMPKVEETAITERM